MTPVKANFHILFVLEGFFPEEKAGTEMYVLNLIRHLPGGIRSSVLISSSNKHRVDYIYENIPVYVFNVPEKPRLKELTGIEPPAGLEEFKEKITSVAPDIVHFHSFGRAINSFHLEWAKLAGYKTVFTPHLSNFFCVKGDFRLYGKKVCDGKVIESRCLDCYHRSRSLPGPVSYLEGIVVSGIPVRLKKMLPPQFHLIKHRQNEIQRVRNACDAVVAISPWIEKKFRINGIEENLHLVPQGIEELNQINGKNELSGGEKINLVFVGRMHPVKGFHVLREAMQQMKSDRFQLDVYTMPSGGEWDYFEDQKKWAQNQSNIVWIENASHEAIMKRLSGYDLMVFPSETEEMAPLVVLEAMSKKVPVLGSSIQAFQDMVSDGFNGAIFEKGSAEDLSKRLSALSAKPGLLREWKENISPVRTVNDVASDMHSIYQKILRG